MFLLTHQNFIGSLIRYSLPIIGTLFFSCQTDTIMCVCLFVCSVLSWIVLCQLQTKRHWWTNPEQGLIIIPSGQVSFAVIGWLRNWSGLITIHALSFSSNATVDVARCILRDGLTSFDFICATHTLSQSSCHFSTLNYNFRAWFSFVKLHNTILVLKKRTMNRSVKYFSNWSTLIVRNSLATCTILEVVVDPKVGKYIGLLWYWRLWCTGCPQSLRRKDKERLFFHVSVCMSTLVSINS